MNTKLLCPLLILACPTLASARSVLASGALYVGYSLSKQGKASSSEIETFANMNLGMFVANGLLVSGKYVFHKTTPQQTGASAPTKTFASFGPSFGYMHNDGFGILGTYLLFPTLTTRETFSDTLFGGTGYSLDVFYLFKAGSWSIGPQLSAFSVTYKKERTDTDTITLQDSRSDTWVQPYVTFAYSF